MSQAWNRQIQNLNRLVNNYAKQITGPGTGFQLGESGPLRPSVISQRFVPTTTTGTNLINNAPVRSNVPARIYSVPGYQQGVVYDEIPNIKPSMDYTGKQVGYKLPNGTITSNPETAMYAKQAMDKARMKALPGMIGKSVGILSTTIPFYKNLAFPVANDLYQGFIMGNPDKSKTLQAALKLAGLDRNGNKIARERTNKTNDTGVPFEILDDNQLTGGKTVQVNNKNGNVSGQPTTQAQALALAQQLGGNPPVANPKEADTQQANINAINDYISKLQEINQPYIELLRRFADNYGDLYNQNQLYNRRMRDLSAITGSPLWYQSAKDYNPLEVEATKIDLQKKIQDAQAGDLNAINEIMGNLAMAQEMGLPPEAAFANKNLLTMMAARDREVNKYQIALENNLMKKYGIDRNYARALTVQAMRGQNALDVASMYTGAYGNGGGVAPGLNKQGTPSNVPASYDVMLQSAHNKNNR